MKSNIDFVAELSSDANLQLCYSQATWTHAHETTPHGGKLAHEGQACHKQESIVCVEDNNPSL